MSRNLVEAETKPVDVTLYDGEGVNKVAINGTGLTVTLYLRDRNGGLVNVTGEVAWLVAADGTVRYSPAAGDLKVERSPYAARFKVTDGSGKDAFYPNGPADVWTVRA